MPLAFIPEADPRQPGLITDCDNWEPTRFGGYGASPSFVEYKPNSSSSTVTQSNPFMFGTARTPTSLFAMWNATTDTGRLFVGYADKLYEVFHVGGVPSFVDVSASLGTYANTIPPPAIKNDSDHWSMQVWDFTNVGNVAIAVNGLNSLQTSTSSGQFSALAGAPSGRTVESVKDFLMVGNISNTYGAVTGLNNMVAWSALGNYADFVPSNSTEAGYQTLTDTPGGITAIRKLGEYAIIYKRAAMYLAQYVGTPYFWSFNLLSDKIGCVSPQHVVDIGLRHIFMGENGEIFDFDGTRPRSISDGFRDTLMRATQSTNIQKVGHNKIERKVIFYNAGTFDSGGLPRHLVLDYDTMRWGQIGNGSGAHTFLIPCKTAVDSFALYDSSVPVNYRMNYLTSLVIDYSDGKLYNRRHWAASTWAAASFLTGVIGDATKTTEIRRVVPLWTTDYNGAMWQAPLTLTPYTSMYDLPGLASTAGTAVAADTRNRIDYRGSAHWHRFKFTTTAVTKAAGSAEYGRPTLIDLLYDTVPAGRE